MRSRRTLGTALLVGVLLGVPVVASAQGGAQSYIVVFRDSAVITLGGGASAKVDRTRVGQLVRDLARRQGIGVANVYDSALGGFAARLTPAQLSAVQAEPSIASVTPDVAVQLADENPLADGSPLAQETLVSLAAPKIPAGVRRVGATQNDDADINGDDGRVDVDVAIIDTGIERDHPDLNVAGGYNCTSADRAKWDDGWGHGTHVAGIVGALDNGRGVVGVAPGARLWAVKVMDNTGSGLMSWIVCGIDWVAAQRSATDDSRPRIEVANMSLRADLPDGGNDQNCGRTRRDAMHSAICRAVAGGTVFVVAAGNDQRDASRYRPSSYEEAITVSAMTDYDGKPGGDGSRPSACGGGYPDDTWAVFSNFGSDVDLTAPGVCVLSTWAGKQYAYASGTSMAAPHVAGVAALYLVRFPGARPGQVRAALEYSGRSDWKRWTDPDGAPDTMVWATGFSKPPDFDIAAKAPTSYASQDADLEVPVTIDRHNGHNAAVKLTVDGLPPALTAVPVKTTRSGATVEIHVADWASSGHYTATINASDGEIAREASFDILVDTAAPAGSFDSPTAAFRIQQNRSMLVSWSESDAGGSGMDGRTMWRQRSSPSAPGNCSGVDYYNVGYPRTDKADYKDSLNNGYCYRWSVSLHDKAGNHTTIESGTVLVDSTAPSTAAVSVVRSTSSVGSPRGVTLPAAYVGTDGTLWLRGGGSGSVDLLIEATDGESGIASYSLTPGATSTGWTFPRTVAGDASMAHLAHAAKTVALSLSVRATNGAGASGGATSLKFAPDGTAPTPAKWTHPTSSLAYTWDGEVALLWSGGSDGGSGLAAEHLVRRERAPVTSSGGCGAYSADGAPRLLAYGSLESDLVSGFCYRWKLRTTDRVGNLADAVRSGNVLVDTIDPKIAIEKPVVGKTTIKTTNAATVSWTASDKGGSRLAAVRVQRQRSGAHDAGACTGATWRNDGAARVVPSPVKEIGLLPGSCYRWIITAYDKATNSAALTSGLVLISATAANEPAPEPSGSAPTVGAAAVTPAASTQLTSTGMVWLDARWSASSAGGSAVAGYELRLSSSGGTSWDTFATPNGATPMMTLRLPAGRTYLLSVRARNTKGAWSAWSTPRFVAVGLAQAETASAFEKVGPWKSVSASGASAGKVTSSASSGAIVRYHFTGRSVALVAPTGPDRGRADVYVDGLRVTTIDLSSPTLTSRKVVFTRTWSTSGNHTVSLQIRSGRVDLDAALVLN